MTRIRREDFLTTLSRSGGYLDVRNMSPELRESFRQAGITETDLAEVAGHDQVIRGREDFGRLFAKIDQRADNDGNSTTIDRGRDGALTRAGSVYEAVRSQVEANRTRTASEGGARFSGVAQLDQVSAGTRTLREGSTGEGVRRVQQALIDMGYANPELLTRGTFDAETARAVRRFQRDTGLSIDGGVGAETLGALAATAPRPGQVLETRPEYSRLYADGRLDVTIAIGFDEGSTAPDGTRRPGSHHAKEREMIQGLRDRQFRHVSHDEIRRMSADDRRRLGLENSRLDPNARYFILDDGAGNNADVVVRLVTPSVGGANARASFERGMQEDELVIYGGHARYGTGPDFDHKTESGAGNFVIDGRGNREHDAPPAGLRSTIGSSSRSDLRALSARPEYQLLIFNGCSTEEYLHNLRNPGVFNRDMNNTDIITTTMPTRQGTSTTHVLGFLDGIMRRDSTTDMVRQQSDVEIAFLNRLNMPDEARQARVLYSTSGFLGNQGTRSRAP